MKKIELSSGVFTVELAEGEAIKWDARFGKNDSLTELHIPDGAVAIAEKAFSYCDNLRRIYMPKSMAHLGHAIFYGTYHHIEIVYAGTEEEFRALAATRRVIRSVQVPGKYDHQPYCNTEGTYYEDRAEMEYFHAFCKSCEVICADGARLKY